MMKGRKKAAKKATSKKQQLVEAKATERAPQTAAPAASRLAAGAILTHRGRRLAPTCSCGLACWASRW